MKEKNKFKIKNCIYLDNVNCSFLWKYILGKIFASIAYSTLSSNTVKVSINFTTAKSRDPFIIKHNKLTDNLKKKKRLKEIVLHRKRKFLGEIKVVLLSS